MKNIVTILKHREEEIDEIFQELSRGNSVYFMMTMDINEIDKVFFSYKVMYFRQISKP